MFSNGRFKRIQIDDEQVDSDDAMFCHNSIILPAPAQQPAMYHRMQCLHPTIHHLRRPGVCRDFRHRVATVRNQPVGAARRQELNT